MVRYENFACLNEHVKVGIIMHEEKNTFVEAENVETLHVGSETSEQVATFERRIPTEREKLAARADAIVAHEIMSALDQQAIGRELVGATV
jgi:hypothetical protein